MVVVLCRQGTFYLLFSGLNRTTHRLLNFIAICMYAHRVTGNNMSLALCRSIYLFSRVVLYLVLFTVLVGEKRYEIICLCVCVFFVFCILIYLERSSFIYLTFFFFVVVLFPCYLVRLLIEGTLYLCYVCLLFGVVEAVSAGISLALGRRCNLFCSSIIFWWAIGVFVCLLTPFCSAFMSRGRTYMISRTIILLLLLFIRRAVTT